MTGMHLCGIRCVSQEDVVFVDVLSGVYLCQKNVSWVEISVDYAVRMHVRHSHRDFTCLHAHTHAF
jgi:hypothetical protein